MKLSSLSLAIALIVAVCATTSHADVFYLDADTPATGSNLGTGPMFVPITTTSGPGIGTITFSGLIDDQIDADAAALGAAGFNFDVPGVGFTATLTFDFGIQNITFLLSGDGGGAFINAYDEFGNLLDRHEEPDTLAGSAGPIRLEAPGVEGTIYSIEWGEFQTDNVARQFAALDNIFMDTHPNPEPGTLGLMALVATGAYVVRRRRKNKCA